MGTRKTRFMGGVDRVGGSKTPTGRGKVQICTPSRRKRLKTFLGGSAGNGRPRCPGRIIWAAPGELMEIDLRCSMCGETSRVSTELLCKIWKRGYDSLGENRKRQAKVKTDIRCHCGNKDVYDSPLFDYMFQIIFRELVLDIH